MSILPITWVSGNINTGTNPSPYQYRNHNYNECGTCDKNTGGDQLFMTGNNYFVAPHLANYSSYSVNDRGIESDSLCLGCTNCPGLGCGVDYSVCPVIGGIQPQSQWSQNSQQANYDMALKTRNSTVVCLYPLATFNDLQTVLDYKNIFGETDDYNKLILPQFCSSQTNTDCPKNPATGAPMEACSRFVSGVSETNPCKDWLLGLDTITADTQLINYCSKYNTPDCLCLNRFDSPVYQVMSYGQTGTDTDSCWWNPCKDSADAPSRYLVTSSIPPCNIDNEQICNNVNVVVGGQSSGLTFVPSEYTSCPLTENGGNTNNNTNNTTNQLLSYWWVFLIALIAILIVIILMIFIK